MFCSFAIIDTKISCSKKYSCPVCVAYVTIDSKSDITRPHVPLQIYTMYTMNKQRKYKLNFKIEVRQRTKDIWISLR